MEDAGGLLHHPWIVRWKLDVHEYHRMGEAGILTRDDRVELIEGELVQMSPIGSGHSGTVNALVDMLFRAVAGRAVVAVQNPVRLSDHSEPQPDFALLRPRADFYRGETATPADVLLLIEVADSSLRFDRLVKLPLYARHRIPEVWVVDLPAGAVEVCRSPTPEGYARVAREGRGASVEPEALPGLRLRVDEILG
jgi:Uma2 family endonuclease